MGTVYVAEEEKLGRRVAIKMISPEFTGSLRKRERFLREARAMATVEHPNIVRVYSFIEDSNQLYLVMEYVDGEDLAVRLKRMGSLQVKEALGIARQVVCALQEAWEKSFVHRDIKPSNILLDKKNRVHVADFGLAKSLAAEREEDDRLTQDGYLVGSPAYMSPEQSNDTAVDFRSDIYSLGIVLYHMLVGRQPFSGLTPLSIISQHVSAALPAIKPQRPDVPPALESLVRWMCRKEPEKRPQSHSALLAQVDDLLEVCDFDQESGSASVSLPVAAIPEPFSGPDAEPGPAKMIFVGREAELAALGGLLDKTLSGDGRVAFVTGAAGSGKTALLQAFGLNAQARHADLLVAGGNGNAQTGIGDPFLPFREVLAMLTGDVEAKRSAGAISRDHALRLWNLIPDSVQALTDVGPDLIDTFIPASDLIRRARAFATVDEEVLSLLDEARARRKGAGREGGPNQSAVFEQYTRVVQSLARKGCLLLLLDDLQWADAGSIHLLFHLGRSIAANRILIVCAYRPEEVALGRSGQRHPLEPVANELKRGFGDVVVELAKAGGRPFVDAYVDTFPNRLGAAFRETLSGHTHGQPMFTVELLRRMQDKGDLIRDEDGRWVEGPSLNWHGLPERVEAVIAERIGRLPETLRDVLRLASIEGVEFTAEVLARVRGEDERDLVRLLSRELENRHRLVAAQGVGRMNSQRMSRFRFPNALFQRYLYNSLDEAERSYLHEDVGVTLEELYAERSQEIAVQLARHFEAAGVNEKAVKYLHLAGNNAVRLFAHQEAIGHFVKGLELMATLPASPERTRQELALQLGLGFPLKATRGFGSPEVGRVFDRARALCDQIGESRSLFEIRLSLATFYGVRGDHGVAIDLGAECVQQARGPEDAMFLAWAMGNQGWNQFFLGRFNDARHNLEESLSIYDTGRLQTSDHIDVRETGIHYLAWLAWTLWCLGHPDQALQRSQDALIKARERNNPYTMAQILTMICSLHAWRREPEAVVEHATKAIDLSKAKGFSLMLAGANFNLGWALAEQGRLEEGIAQMRGSLDAWKATGAALFRPCFLAHLASACRKAGRTAEGLAVVDEAFDAMQESGERYWEAELHRQRGQLLQMEGGAEDCFLKAMDVSRSQGAKMCELRAVVNLGRLWMGQGRRAEARERLEAVYGSFTEGHDIVDLKRAKALLEALS